MTVYRRAGEGWVSEFLTELTDVLPLPGIGSELPLAAVYERTGIRF